MTPGECNDIEWNSAVRRVRLRPKLQNSQSSDIRSLSRCNDCRLTLTFKTLYSVVVCAFIFAFYSATLFYNHTLTCVSNVRVPCLCGMLEKLVFMKRNNKFLYKMFGGKKARIAVNVHTLGVCC